MTIKPLGYDGAMQRVSEIMSRLKCLEPPAPRQAPGQSPLMGAIGGNVPLNPFGASVAVAPNELRNLIQSAAAKAGVDPLLFESLVAQESGFNPKATSSKGAMGLSQLMPGTAKALGVTDPYDPAQNLDAGARYFAQMMRQFGDDEKLALAAYNAGPGAVERWGSIPPNKETQHYVTNVLAHRAALRGDR